MGDGHVSFLRYVERNFFIDWDLCLLPRPNWFRQRDEKDFFVRVYFNAFFTTYFYKS